MDQRGGSGGVRETDEDGLEKEDRIRQRGTEKSDFLGPDVPLTRRPAAQTSQSASKLHSQPLTGFMNLPGQDGLTSSVTLSVHLNAFDLYSWYKYLTDT